MVLQLLGSFVADMSKYQYEITVKRLGALSLIIKFGFNTKSSKLERCR